AASSPCRRPGGQGGGVRCAAPPVLLAGAARLQRLLTAGQRKRARGKAVLEEARACRGSRREPARDERRTGDGQGEAGERADVSRTDEDSRGGNDAASGRRKRVGGCRRGRGRKGGCRCCTVPRRVLSKVGRASCR